MESRSAEPLTPCQTRPSMDDTPQTPCRRGRPRTTRVRRSGHVVRNRRRAFVAEAWSELAAGRRRIGNGRQVDRRGTECGRCCRSVGRRADRGGWRKHRRRPDQRLGQRGNRIGRASARAGVGRGYVRRTRPGVVHRAHLPVTMVAGTFRGNAAGRLRRTHGGGNKDQQADVEDEPAASDACELRPDPAH